MPSTARRGDGSQAAAATAGRPPLPPLPLYAAQTIRLAANVLSPALLFLGLLGLLLSALSIILDTPVSALIDTSLRTLPAVLHALQGLPGRAEPLALSPAMRSLLLTPLRAPPVALACLAVYLVCFRGFELLVRTRGGFEQGYRAATRPQTMSNAARRGDGEGAAARSEERLHSILDAWGKLIALMRAVRLAAFGIAGLALLERLVQHLALSPGAAPRVLAPPTAPTACADRAGGVVPPHDHQR